jgi:hypothetical protein
MAFPEQGQNPAQWTPPEKARFFFNPVAQQNNTVSVPFPKKKAVLFRLKLVV